MKIVYIPEVIDSKKQNKKFYVIRLCLMKDTEIIVKSQPLLWLSEEQYLQYTSQK